MCHEAKANRFMTRIGKSMSQKRKENRMKYKIILIKPNMRLELPDSDLDTLSKAVERVKIYKKSNPYAYYYVRDTELNYEFEV